MTRIIYRPSQATALIATLIMLTGTIAQAAEPEAKAGQSEFHFARMAFGAYGSQPGSSRREPWLRDWPDAEVHFIQGVSRLTRIDSGTDNRQIFLDDDSLFDHPMLYAVKVGYWQLSDYETHRLREFLMRGGFLIVDDFHGPAEWVTFSESLRRVFPNRPIVEIPSDDEVFNVLYTLDQRVQIPGAQAIQYGVTWEHPQGTVPYWRGVYDDAGRLLVAINFNMDLGDAWEHADDAFYPEPLTALAYRFGINYVIYSMTH